MEVSGVRVSGVEVNGVEYGGHMRGEEPEQSPLKHRVPGRGPFWPRVVSL